MANHEDTQRPAWGHESAAEFFLSPAKLLLSKLCSDPFCGTSKLYSDSCHSPGVRPGDPADAYLATPFQCCFRADGPVPHRRMPDRNPQKEAGAQMNRDEPNEHKKLPLQQLRSCRDTALYRKSATREGRWPRSILSHHHCKSLGISQPPWHSELPLGSCVARASSRTSSGGKWMSTRPPSTFVSKVATFRPALLIPLPVSKL